MIDKIKEQIDKNREDKETLNEYIKSFVESEKAKELFNENEEFKSLLDNKENDNKKEDDFF